MHAESHNFVNENRCFCFQYSALFWFHVVVALVAAQGCFDPSIKVDTYVKTPEPWTYMKNEELPKEYDP